MATGMPARFGFASARQAAPCSAFDSITGTVIQGGAMSFHSRKRNRDVVRNAGSTHPNGHATGRMDAGARWDVSATRASKGGSMPRLGAVLLAIVVVALLTIGLHVLFQ
jgi:hypothetical protein